MNIKIDIQDNIGEENLRDKTGLICNIVAAYRENPDKIVLHSGAEGFNYSVNGLYDLLDQVTQRLDFDPSKLVLTTTNWSEEHPVYTIQKNDSVFLKNFKDKKTFTQCEQNNYGMFIGRANNTRMYALTKYLTTYYPSITSFNHNFEENITPIPFMQEFPEDYARIKKITPYSDIGDVILPPISYPLNTLQWDDVYKNVAIEVVCETSPHADTFFITEKTCRPIYYHRLFLIVGSKGYCEKLRNLGFDIEEVDGYKRALGSFRRTFQHLPAYPRYV